MFPMMHLELGLPVIWFANKSVRQHYQFEMNHLNGTELQTRITKWWGGGRMPAPCPQSPICYQYKMAPVNTVHCIQWDRQLCRLGTNQIIISLQNNPFRICLILQCQSTLKNKGLKESGHNPIKAPFRHHQVRVAILKPDSSDQLLHLCLHSFKIP